jgi:hypothetical protein
MIDEGMTAMSYANLCRLVQKHIAPVADTAQSASPLSNASRKPSPSPEKSSPRQATPKALQPEKPLSELSEQERLDRMKEEAFAAVRSKTPAGPLLMKPLSREEEHRKLFGPKVKSDTPQP